MTVGTTADGAHIGTSACAVGDRNGQSVPPRRVDGQRPRRIRRAVPCL